MPPMKTFIRFSLLVGLVVALTSCGKEEKPLEPEEPVVEEAKGFLSTTKEKAGEYKDVAVEKTVELKESAGGAIEKATDSVLGFKDRAGEAIKNVKLGSED